MIAESKCLTLRATSFQGALLWNVNLKTCLASTTLADSVYAAIPRGPIVGSSGSAEAVA
jgi:hypothetical protein